MCRQDNQSRSTGRTIRGLTCSCGVLRELIRVIEADLRRWVDVREGSQFRKWVGVMLSAASGSASLRLRTALPSSARSRGQYKCTDLCRRNSGSRGAIRRSGGSSPIEQPFPRRGRVSFPLSAVMARLVVRPLERLL
jgi:hypothetical protein